MTYLQRSSEKNSRQRRNIKFASIFIAIILFGFIFRSFSGKIAHSFLYPITNATNYVLQPFKNFGHYLASKPRLVEENKILQNDKKFLQIELLSTESLRKENEELRKILEIRSQDKSDIIAEVLLTPPFSPYDTFVIHTEKIDEVEIGDAVFAGEVVIGEIIEKHARNAIVKLYSTSGYKIPVRINNEIVAEAEGQGGLSFKIQLPKDVPISKGDLVYSQSNPNAILGAVESIEIADNSSFQNVRFQYPFNFSGLHFVRIRENLINN